MKRMHNENMDGPCEDESLESKGFCIQSATTQDIQTFLDDFAEENDIVLGFTVGFVTIDQELAEFIENLVPTFDKSLSNVVNDQIKSQYSQFRFQHRFLTSYEKRYDGASLLKPISVCIRFQKKLGASESGASSFLSSRRNLS